MQETFHIKQHLNYGEFINLTINALLKMRVIRKIFLFYSIGILLFISFEVIFLHPGSKELYSVFRQIFFIPFIPIISLSIFVLLFSSLYYLINPKLFKNVSYAFTHWGMEQTVKGVVFSIPWRNFLK